MLRVAAVVLLVPAWAGAEVDPGEMEVGGRVFARGETWRDGDGEYLAQGSVESARLEGKYTWAWLRAVVEVEFSEGDADLKDAYLRATSDPWRAQAGNFKEPISAIMMESGWDLPLTERGLLHGALTDRLQIGFRRPGLMGTWRGGGFLDPKASIGVFQGTDITGLDRPDLLRSAARVSVEPGPVEVALFFEHRDTVPDGLQTERFVCAGADATVRFAGLRLWADAIGGSSWLDAMVLDDDEATFLVSRAIAAYRFFGDEDGAFYLEPYAMVGLLDPDLDVRKDLISEVVAGVNVGAWDRARVQLEFQRWGIQENTPDIYGAYDRIAFVAQIGAAF